MGHVQRRDLTLCVEAKSSDLVDGDNFRRIANTYVTLGELPGKRTHQESGLASFRRPVPDRGRLRPQDGHPPFVDCVKVGTQPLSYGL